MTINAAAMNGILETLGGRNAAPQYMNEDLAFHAMELALEPRSSLLSRLAGRVSRFLAPSSVVSVRGFSAHMMQDLGLDPITALAAPNQDVRIPRPSARTRPIVIGDHVPAA